jgi:DNA-binding MarR family transcriptional regulator
MNIEQAIKQKSFKDEFHKAGVNILYTASWLSLNQAQVFKRYGLTGPQFNVLRILRGSNPKPATINEIIERMLDKSSNASRIVEKLRIKKLVERVVCPEDRRAVNVRITKEGLDLLAQIDNEQEQLGAGFNVLTEEEAKTLNCLLDKLRS